MGESGQIGVSNATRVSTPAQGICDRLSISKQTLEFAGRVGIGIVRMDIEPPELNDNATQWLGVEAQAFCDSEVVAQGRTTTDPDARWIYTTAAGRTLRIKRLFDGTRLWLAMTDTTRETNYTSLIADAAEIGTGCLLYVPSTGRHHVYGSFLDSKLTPSEQLEIRQRGILPLIHKRDQKRGIDLIKAMMDEGTPINTIIECRTRRGETFTLEVSARAIRSTDGTICKSVGVFRDVTRERRSQAELMRLRNEVASNTEAQNHLLARVGHEIRTPMSGVIGMADALMHTDGTEAFRNQLSIIQNATRDAIAMLDETMDFSTLGTDQFKLRRDEIDIGELVREAAGLWSQRAQAVGTRLSLRRDASLPKIVLVDSRRLRQCLTNILSNAVKFTEGGVIDIVLGTAKTKDGEQLIIAVQDSGVGMTDVELKRLFVPYAQGSAGEAFGGTGLGMSITREILGRMNGTIRCQSEVGKGTTFIITLPLELPDGSDLVDNLLAGRTDGGDFMDLRVLAVDDNETNRLVLEHLLADRVTKLDLAEDGIDAIERLDSAPYDVIIMDIHMPRMDGIEATLAIRSSGKSYADIPIIALTADTQYQQKRVAINLGMDDVLAKPISLSNLLEAFTRANLLEPGADRLIA